MVSILYLLLVRDWKGLGFSFFSFFLHFVSCCEIRRAINRNDMSQVLVVYLDNKSQINGGYCHVTL